VSLCFPVTRSEGCNPSSLLSLTLHKNCHSSPRVCPFNRLYHTPYPLARLRVARLPSHRSGLTALWMGGSPSHPSSSHLPTSLQGIEFQGQRATFGSPGQWSPNTVFNSRWKLMPPFQVPSTAIVVSFSAHPLISSPAINSKCYSHSLTSSYRSIYITYSYL
jgi:hypothetical protein